MGEGPGEGRKAMRILLTGARAPVTLDLARRFHAARHTVFLADSLRFALARSSRSVERMRCVPAPRASAAKYVDALLEAISLRKIDLLIPTCEEVFFIAHYLDRFRGACRVFADPIDKLERIHNKWKFSQAAYSTHARSPESHLLAESAHVQPFLNEAADWVFKPVYSRFAAETKVGPSRMDATAIRPTPGKPWIAQRRIIGKEYSTYSVARDGHLLAHAMYRSAYKVGLGSGIYFITCENEAIESFVRDFVASERYTGQIGFDVIVDAHGQPWVLEANPRATSGVHLFAPGDALIDAFLTWEDEAPAEPLNDRNRHAQTARPAPRPPFRPSPGPPCMLGLAMASWGLPDALRRCALGSFLRDCWRARDVVFDWRDPLPALLMPIAFAEIVGIALRERRVLTEAATYDIEWNGEPL